MSLTDMVLSAIRAELQARRAEIDNDGSLKTVTVKVFMRRGVGVPQSVSFSKDCEKDLTGR